MPVLAACQMIYVFSIVCIVFLYMLVANKVLSLSLSHTPLLLHLLFFIVSEMTYNVLSGTLKLTENN